MLDTGEPMLYHGLARLLRIMYSHVEALLDMVGLLRTVWEDIPKFSGGQRRIGIARALSLNPRLLVV